VQVNSQHHTRCKLSLLLFFCLVHILLSQYSIAQNCPPNIDFENGNFNGWKCYTGITEAVDTTNVISLSETGGPVYGRHTMYNSGMNLVDYYGGFPVSCPNGSGHSVKLGSTEAGGQAEGISYEFTIPSTENSYSLTYYYAVVFQAPHHQRNEQPRMETEIINVTDGSVISCASFSFIAVGSSIPGFEVSERSDTIDVLYKNWSAVSVDLSGNAGKRIRLFFKTADCTFRRHFGYAYIDVNSECNNNLTGATFCPDDTLVNIVAPYGYQKYTWYDSTVNEVLGTRQTLTMPPPIPGTMLAVKLEPFAGYGCPRTLFSRVADTLTVIANAGSDAVACQDDTLQIGTIPREGLVYKWLPPDGLSNPAIANPIVAHGMNHQYVVSTANSGGGCRSTDTVIVVSSVLNTALKVIGKDAYCFGHGDSAILKVNQALHIEWYKDGEKLDVLTNQTSCRVTSSGNYYALLADELGCSIATAKRPIIIDYDRPGIRYPLKYAVKNLPLELAARDFGATALWQPGFYLDNPASFTPSFTGNQEQLYNINITSRGGCITIDTQMVKVVEHVEIYVPPAFTPNNDGKNDYLHPIFRGVAKIKTFRVFNRLGQMLFEGNTELPGWDGIFKGWPQPTQTVVWMLECTGVDGMPYLQKGTSVLIR
jgi:gliding motility-associated-like protein